MFVPSWFKLYCMVETARPRTASLGAKDMRRYILLLLMLPAGSLMQAQPYQKHHLTAGLGVATPQGELNDYYEGAFSWTLAYGYRPASFFQIDLGWDGAYNAARVNDYFESNTFGAVRIRDFQHYFPVGGRLVLPLADGKAELYGGGGGAYMRYSEGLRQPSDFYRIDCPVCNARDGFGFYALAGGNVALNRSQSLRLGVTTKMYKATTDGLSVGVIPAAKTKDRWVNVYLHLTLSL